MAALLDPNFAALPPEARGHRRALRRRFDLVEVIAPASGIPPSYVFDTVMTTGTTPSFPAAERRLPTIADQGGSRVNARADLAISVKHAAHPEALQRRTGPPKFADETLPSTWELPSFCWRIGMPEQSSGFGVRAERAARVCLGDQPGPLPD